MSTLRWATRPETAADVPAIRAVVLAAFETALEADLVEALRADRSWLPGLSVVAETPDGTVVGHALLTRCHIDDTPALCLAPVAVRPDHQRTGAGAAAVRAALAAARAQGEHTVTVLGHPEYYPRFGFRRASLHGIKTTFDVPDEALMALDLDSDSPLPGGILRYATPFGV
ncbi:putative N-acetyltransferase YhbS [Kitasatospora gansuensis]|uniref:Putative N-acetyltransferase YhbS n=1 Tax=Kitasatospora gansuensis TaxID=258050 RepID=A0A7W7WFT0_9ACTN|nr:N-acetyltransferase [Kitasatospora gansuensis]MBB4945268.1 putative N-acetyltransferase YhbS [Kitasatospora gansuensis]